MYSKELIVDILIYIDNNLKNKVSIEDLVLKFNYNRFYIMKLFKKELSISIFDYINILKIHNSLDSIKENYSFLTVALKNGFYSLEYYSEIFKKIIGINPTTYKKIINHDNNITDIDYDTCTNNLANINQLLNKIDNYKNNLKPTSFQVKRLTIFK